MNSKYLDKLEYNKILEILESFAKTYLGKNLCRNLKPSTNVTFLLEQTNQALGLIYKKGNLPLSSIPNIDIAIKNLESNFALTALDLLEIGSILKTSRELREYFLNEDFSLILDSCDLIYINKLLEKEIFDKILDENTIADSASSKLSSIRKSQKNLGVEIKNKLNSIVHSNTYSKYLQDSIVTIKNERYVIPVKEEYRSQIKGFVHDVSSSGSTIFIEPLAVFELNNELNNLKAEEAIEIAKILTELSKKLMIITNELKNNIQLIGQLDFIFSKASFSKKLNGIKPNINNEKYINLIQARHPLIDESKVVPIDISIGKDYSSLIITGPNTGGKTVCLKTTGLLLLMAYSGILIPCKENSSIYVFDNIFADIGDEQSIAESLSTFSSHILNIVEIAKNATQNSLILLDELGSGTDPIEGSHLAISILDYFYNLGAIVISTTHYEELKQYAIITNGFENASFEFDLETLSPTYKLLIGIPGKSNAFEISERLGLKGSILDKARSLIDNDNICIEDLLKEIYNNQIEIEKQKEEISKNLRQVEMLRKKLETDYSDSEEKAILMVENAKKEARDILLDVQDEATQIIKKMNSLSKKNSKTSLQEMYDLKNKVTDKIKDFSINNKNQKGNLSTDEIKLGMQVYVIPLGKNGTIVKLPNASSEVEIQVGSLKTTVTIDRLVKTKQEALTSIKPTKNKSIIKSKNISNEINVIGLTVDEAIPIIDKYLDDASIAKLETVRIVHGKGTGKLKVGIHTFLKKHPHVKSYRMGTFGEGEMGVTVVTIK